MECCFYIFHVYGLPIYESRKHDGYQSFRDLRIREFKECVSVELQLRKRNVHPCFPQRLLTFPFADIHVSVE